MTNDKEFTLAAIQAAPVYFDREASTDKACQLIEQAAREGAALVAFSEAWLPGYPFYVQRDELRGQARTEYLATAVEIPSPTTDRLCKAAQKAGIDVVIGIVELDAKTRGTTYCTLLFIGREGEILGRHRKLKPTGWERTVWGEGDGRGLTTYDRPYGLISGLSCWEHAMVLPGYALMTQGTQIHIAAWPSAAILSRTLWTQGLLLSQAFALQGSCYVIVTCALVRSDDFPERYRSLVDEWWDEGEGGSCIIAPGGTIVAQAPTSEEMILTASVSLDAVYQARTIIDVAGHYSRPDILQLRVNERPAERIVYGDASDFIEPTAISSSADGDPDSFRPEDGTEKATVQRDDLG